MVHQVVSSLTTTGRFVPLLFPSISFRTLKNLQPSIDSLSFSPPILTTFCTSYGSQEGTMGLYPVMEEFFFKFHYFELNCVMTFYLNISTYITCKTTVIKSPTTVFGFLRELRKPQLLPQRNRRCDCAELIGQWQNSGTSNFNPLLKILFIDVFIFRKGTSRLLTPLYVSYLFR